MKLNPTLLICIPLLLICSCGQKPTPGDDQARLGYLAYEQRKFETARTHLEAALELELRQEDTAYVLTCLGNTLDELGEFEAAVEQHRKALELNPDFHEAWVNLTVVYADLGRLDDAEASMEKAIDLGYHNADGLRDLIQDYREASVR